MKYLACIFQHQLQALADSKPIIALDFPGFWSSYGLFKVVNVAFRTEVMTVPSVVCSSLTVYKASPFPYPFSKRKSYNFTQKSCKGFIFFF